MKNYKELKEKDVQQINGGSDIVSILVFNYWIGTKIAKFVTK